MKKLTKRLIGLGILIVGINLVPAEAAEKRKLKVRPWAPVYSEPLAQCTTNDGAVRVTLLENMGPRPGRMSLMAIVEELNTLDEDCNLVPSAVTMAIPGRLSPKNEDLFEAKGVNASITIRFRENSDPDSFDEVTILGKEAGKWWPAKRAINPEACTPPNEAGEFDPEQWVDISTHAKCVRWQLQSIGVHN